MEKNYREKTGLVQLIIIAVTAVAALSAVFLCAPTASATGQNAASSLTSSQPPGNRTSSDPDEGVSEVIVSSNPQETLGTMGFSDSNTKRITVGKSTVLYLSIRDMGYDYHTQFETSDKTVATVQKVDNRAVKVVGLKSGTVTVTATIQKSDTVTLTAKYELEIGDREDVRSDESADTVSHGNAGIVEDTSDNTDLELYSSTADPMLLEYAKSRRTGSAASLLLGLIGWGMIIFAVFYVFSVIIRSRTPKLNVSPGSRRRYSASSSGVMRSRGRLLPDRYYRNLKKY